MAFSKGTGMSIILRLIGDAPRLQEVLDGLLALRRHRYRATHFHSDFGHKAIRWGQVEFALI